MRFHLALAVNDLDAAVEDYTEKLGEPPVYRGPKYALWRTPLINLSLSKSVNKGETLLRHIGIENDIVDHTTWHIDSNGLEWEFFTVEGQDEEIERIYG